jgi:hypothetical protein
VKPGASISNFSCRAQLWLAAFALASSALTQAAPVILSTNPGISSYTFSVDSAHHITNPASGLFGDVFSFTLGSTLAATTTSIFYNGDISNFAVRLYLGSVPNADSASNFNLVASGTNVGVGGSDPLHHPISYNNSIILDSLAAGIYSLVITGNDLTGGDPYPYSLQVAVGPAFRSSSSSNVPEPATILLLALALACTTLSARRRGI